MLVCLTLVTTAQVLTNMPLSECMALWGQPDELSIQHHVYIFMQYVDSYLVMVQITHNLNGTRVSHACAKAKNMHGIKPRVYTCVK